MAIEKRLPANAPTQKKLGTGIHMAKVVSHLDPSFMGGLEVTLLRENGNSVGNATQTYTVRYATPFYGSTAFEYMGSNKADFNDTQKSYGMWFTPPDVGVTVLCTFIDGNPAEGYWFGCVPGRFVNNMIPAIAATEQVELTDELKKKFGTSTRLPVGEINRRANTLSTSMDVNKVKKAVHPIADVFLEQGLLDDDVRGSSDSSVRRDIPNMVFGISTPGPLDRRDGAKKGVLGKRQSLSPPVPVSRLGGTQLVFDDGDDQYRRLTHPSQGPVEYIDTLDTKEKRKGDPTIPYGECFRIRTRTGHQILLHNSEDLIYIGNSRGTTWVELTSNGKIDVFAEDSISIHTKTDLNIRASRDINMEAGRNINFKTDSGRWHADIATDLEFFPNNNALITVGKDLDVLVGSNTKFSTVANFDLNTNGNNTFSAGGNTDIGTGGNLTVSATGDIHWNGPAARAADTAAQVKPLTLHENATVSTIAGWDKKYQSGTMFSIMKRIPQHEPWPLHENQAPSFFTPENTDRDVE